MKALLITKCGCSQLLFIDTIGNKPPMQYTVALYNGAKMLSVREIDNMPEQIQTRTFELIGRIDQDIYKYREI